MKKFTTAITALHEAETSAKSELQKSYIEYCTAKLNKFGAKSLVDLTSEQKNEFFTEISKDWERGQGATKADQADIKEHEVKESVNEAFEVHYSDGVRAMKKFNDKNKAMSFAKDLIKTNKSLQFVDIFNAGSGFNSTADTDAIVAFWGDGSYTDNVAKKDSKLAAKKIEESVDMSEAEINSEEEFKEYAQTVLKKAFGDKYDDDKANKTIDGILKKCGDDWGACIGMLTSGLGESKNTNESVNTLNEGTTLYISDPKFKDEASLKADILKKVGPALNDLLSRQGVKYNPLTATDRRGVIAFESKPMTGKDLGFMQYGFKEVYIDIFSGGGFPQINKATGENFEFSPYIWATLHYSYKHTLGGSNGCSLIFTGEDSDSIFYDVVDGRWLTQREAARRSDWK